VETRARKYDRVTVRKVLLASAAFGLLLAPTVWGGSVLATPISEDTYTNPESQHRTQVEPDSFGFGSTVVATFQTGRVFDGGASNIAWATTTDAGLHWTHGNLPATTIFEGGPWLRISDPAVAYDPAHNVWMINTLGFGTASSPFGSPSALLVSRSTDGGLTWGNPVTVSLGSTNFYDKNWITCDTWPSSPFFGNCYAQWDDFGIGNRILMSTSTDGGLTWSAKVSPGDLPSGLGGQPVVQPTGTVVVPYSANDTAIRVFRSMDGGASWTNSTPVSTITDHVVAGGLRTSPLPSAEVDGAGRVYVVWQDCRFRTGCAQNDIVMSTTTDGFTWTPVVRIPIDLATSTVDHFIPGIAVDRATSGSSARLALGYYYYPVSNCGGSCQLTMGFTSSTDGGATWTPPRQVTAPMNLTWIADTSQGRMVGDYISTSFAGGKAIPVFATAKAPDGGSYRERAAAAAFSTGGPVTIPVDSKRVFWGRPSRKPLGELPTRH
jgi:hypothetical protein